jgi:hypothetical protein
MVIPPPKDWNEFQDITLSALKLRWRSANLQQNGRQGQSQAGVDIYGPDDLGRLAGVQCKQTTDELSLKTVLDEVKKAEDFKPVVEAFFMATTGKRDAKIQTDVRLLSENRLKVGKFPVGVLFWEDIVQDLVTSPAEFKKHYPQILVVDPGAATGFNLLCALDVAYWGLGIKQSMALIFGEIGQIANEEPHQIDRLLRGVEACAQVFMKSDEHADVVECSRDLVAACHAAATQRHGWGKANGLATKLEGIVESIENRVVGRALAAYSLGKFLRHWDIRVVNGKAAPSKLEEDVLQSVRALAADETLAGQVQAIIQQSTEEDEGLPHRAYGCVRHYLLDEGMG